VVDRAFLWLFVLALLALHSSLDLFSSLDNIPLAFLSTKASDFFILSAETPENKKPSL